MESKETHTADAALDGREWSMEGELMRVGGEGGWIATQSMTLRSSTWGAGASAGAAQRNARFVGGSEVQCTPQGVGECRMVRRTFITSDIRLDIMPDITPDITRGARPVRIPRRSLPLTGRDKFQTPD